MTSSAPKLGETQFENEFNVSKVYPHVSVLVSSALSRCKEFMYLGVKMNKSRENLNVLFIRLSDMTLIGKIHRLIRFITFKRNNSNEKYLFDHEFGKNFFRRKRVAADFWRF